MKKCQICEETLPVGAEHKGPLDCVRHLQDKNRALAVRPEEVSLPGVAGEVFEAVKKDPFVGIAGLVLLAALPLVLGLVGPPSRKARKGHP